MDDDALALGGRRILPPVGVGPAGCGWRLAIGADCADDDDDDVAPLLPLAVAEPRGFFLRYGLTIAMMDEQRRKGNDSKWLLRWLSKLSNGLDAEKVKVRCGIQNANCELMRARPRQTQQLNSKTSTRCAAKQDTGRKIGTMFSIEP